MTSKPFDTQISVRVEPMNPVAPVIKIVSLSDISISSTPFDDDYFVCDGGGELSLVGELVFVAS